MSEAVLDSTAEEAPGKKGLVEDWSRDKQVFGVPWGKAMMWIFLLSDTFIFSCFLVGYMSVRIATTDPWPNPSEVFALEAFGHPVPLLLIAIMTFILIMSSVTMVLAVEAGHRMDRLAVEKWMLWTILGGIAFLGCQAWEWSHFIHGAHEGPMVAEGTTFFGANLIQNQYGPPTFADLFFFITGFHGTHVLSGVILNIIIFFNVVVGLYDRRGHYEMVEKVGLYWHFVDLVWVFVFTFYYLV